MNFDHAAKVQALQAGQWAFMHQQVLRALKVFGSDDAPHGHMEVDLIDVRVPTSNVLLDEGRGFEIEMIKVVAPLMACEVIDMGIQSHGGAGVSDDFVLAGFYAGARTLRLADGPDEVHRESIAKLELGRQRALRTGIKAPEIDMPITRGS